MKRSIYLRLVLTVILIYFVSNVVVAGIAALVIGPETMSMLPTHDMPRGLRIVVLITTVFSLLLGSLITLLAIRRTVKPIREMSSAAKKIAQGDFHVLVDTRRKDEIGELAKNFNIMASELQKIEVMRDDFVSSVSHEFKTPLVSIEGYAKLLMDEDLSKTQKEYVDIILSEVGRLSRMSSNILLLNRLENENYDHTKKDYDLAEQIRKAILLLEREWSEKNINLNIDLQTTTVNASEDLLMQVWLNLIGNAIKFSPDGGDIDITISSHNGQMIFKIVNYGDLLTEEEIRHIFDKFYQGDKSRNREGNGLGLSIVQRIIHLHGGEITATSNEKEGTAFVARFPQK